MARKRKGPTPRRANSNGDSPPETLEPMSGASLEAPSSPGMGVSVFREGEAPMELQMVVNPGNVISPADDDQSYTEGQVITVDGPTAIALWTGGFATPAPATTG